MSKKIKLTINGDIYELPKKLVLKGSTQWDDETYIQMRKKVLPSIIKQYVKKNFPNLKVWAVLMFIVVVPELEFVTKMVQELLVQSLIKYLNGNTFYKVVLQWYD